MSEDVVSGAPMPTVRACPSGPRRRRGARSGRAGRARRRRSRRRGRHGPHGRAVVRHRQGRPRALRRGRSGRVRHACTTSGFTRVLRPQAPRHPEHRGAGRGRARARHGVDSSTRTPPAATTMLRAFVAGAHEGAADVGGRAAGDARGHGADVGAGRVDVRRPARASRATRGATASCAAGSSSTACARSDSARWCRACVRPVPTSTTRRAS